MNYFIYIEDGIEEDAHPFPPCKITKGRIDLGKIEEDS